jgi:RHS repeat-associated protein
LIISYDLLNRLTLTESKKGGSVLFSAAYTLDSAGMRTRVVENLAGTNRTVNYTYDGLYRLLSESDGSSTTGYTYSPTGNRLTKTSGAITANYVYDANDRLLTDGTSTFTYDSNGNKKTETKAGVTTTYTWDAENRLRATQGGGSSTVYDYDYAGTRVSQSVNGVETRFLVDKNRNYAQVLEEYGSNGAIQAAYVYGNDLISQDRNGTKSFYVYDGLGSTRALTDATGIVTDSYSYDAYGNLSSSTGTTVNSYLYAGEQFDKNLGDYYLRDRYYSTDIGRFTQRDRFDGDLNMPLSLNRYGYTHGNPVNGIDPSGMFVEGDFLVANKLQSDLQAQQTPVYIHTVNASRETLFKAAVETGLNVLRVSLAILARTILDEIVDEVANQYRIPILIFGGNDLREHAQHVFSAQIGFGYTRSRREAKGFHLPINDAPPHQTSDLLLQFKSLRSDSRWIGNVIKPGSPEVQNYKNITGITPERDEYPFGTTNQGGKYNYSQNDNVSLRLVSETESSRQGGYIRTFYNDPNVDLQPTFLRGLFVVIPIPFKGVDSGFFDRRAVYHKFGG